MKYFFKAAYLLIVAVFFAQCSKEFELPENLVVKDFAWKGLNAYYLHQDDIADLSDRRFSSDRELNAYLSSFTDYNALFSNLLILFTNILLSNISSWNLSLKFVVYNRFSFHLLIYILI